MMVMKCGELTNGNGGNGWLGGGGNGFELNGFRVFNVPVVLLVCFGLNIDSVDDLCNEVLLEGGNWA